VQETPRLRVSRSYTSRQARAGEANGLDYNFVSRKDFEVRIQENQFLEWADVFGNLYGTSHEDTERVLASGNDLVLVIEIQGARQVRSGGIVATTIFVLPPSADTLERRLRGRSCDSEDQIVRRLGIARGEVEEMAAYDYVVVNDEISGAVERLKAIVTAERARTGRMAAETTRIVGTFGGAA
jgi:guanylate kinase